MRRKVWLICIACMIFLCGCSMQEDVQPREQESVTLTFMMPQSHAKDFLLELIDTYEEEHPGMTIEVQRIPDDQWIDLVHSKAAVGEMPDIIRLDKWVLEAVGTKHFVEFTEETEWYNRILPEQIENKLIDGKLYGLPISSTSGIGLIYNEEIFRRLSLSVPETMEELLEVSRILKQKGLIPVYASDKEAWTIQVAFNCMVMQCTEEAAWQSLLRNQVKWSEVEEYKTILQDMKVLRELGYTNEDHMEATYNSAVEAVAKGEAAMYVMGQFFIEDVLRQNPECELMMVPFPYNGSDLLSIVSGAGMFAVSRESEHVQEAEEFLEWFAAAEHMNKFNAGWNHPPVLKDQNIHMKSWQQYIYDNYILQDKVVVQLDETLNGINLNGLWNDLKEMLAGRLDEEQVLEKWDQDFSEQMRYRGERGW